MASGRDRLGRWARRAAVGLAVAAVLFAIGESSLVRVPRGDSLVVQRFGQPRRVLGPGLQLKLPWPIETARAVTTSQVRFMPIGFKAVDRFIDRRPTPEESQWLTGDTHLVELAAMVEFQVRDPVAFLFGVEEGPDGAAGFLVRKLAEAELTERVGRLGVDTLLGGAGHRLQGELQSAVQRRFDRAGCGLEVVSVQVLRLSAPEELSRDFAAVSTARAEAEAARNRADGRSQVILQEAEAQALRLVREAQNEAGRQLAEAKGRARAFLAQRASVQEHPEVSRQRLWLDAVRGALGRAEVVRVPMDGEGGPRIIRVRDREQD